MEATTGISPFCKQQVTASILISGATIVAHLGHRIIQLNRSYQEDILTIVVATEKTVEEEEDKDSRKSRKQGLTRTIMMTISLTLMIFPDTDLGDSFVSVIWCQSKHAIFNILVLLCKDFCL